MITFERIAGVLPVRYSTRVMPEIQKTVLEELLIHEDTGRATEVRAIDDDPLLGIEGVQRVLQALKKDARSLGQAMAEIEDEFEFEDD